MSSKVIDLDVNRKRICDATFSLIVGLTLDVSPRNWLVFPYPLFDAPTQENPLEFLDVTYHVKTIGPDWTTVWRKISQSHL